MSYRDRPGSAPTRLSPSGQNLIEKARGNQYGLRFLQEGYLESVAVIHRVHPKVVLEVRGYLNQSQQDAQA